MSEAQGCVDDVEQVIKCKALKSASVYNMWNETFFKIIKWMNKRVQKHLSTFGENIFCSEENI